MLHLFTIQDDGSCRHLPEMSFLISLAGGAPPQAALETQVSKTNWCKYFGSETHSKSPGYASVSECLDA